MVQTIEFEGNLRQSISGLVRQAVLLWSKSMAITAEHVISWPQIVLADCIAITVAVVGSGILTWKKQETLKANYQEKLTHVQSELAKQTSRLDAELQQQNFRHSTVFVKTEESIAGIYARLLKLLDIVEDHTFLMAADNDETKKQARLKELNETYNEFFNYYRPRKIYLRKSTAKKTMELINNTNSILSTSYRANTLRARPLTAAGQEQVERLDLRFEELQNKITPLLLTLEDEFQDVLGFPKEKED
jgi:hypothetical protein